MMCVPALHVYTLPISCFAYHIFLPSFLSTVPVWDLRVSPKGGVRTNTFEHRLGMDLNKRISLQLNPPFGIRLFIAAARAAAHANHVPKNSLGSCQRGQTFLSRYRSLDGPVNASTMLVVSGGIFCPGSVFHAGDDDRQGRSSCRLTRGVQPAEEHKSAPSHHIGPYPFSTTARPWWRIVFPSISWTSQPSFMAPVASRTFWCNSPKVILAWPIRPHYDFQLPKNHRWKPLETSHLLPESVIQTKNFNFL